MRHPVGNVLAADAQSRAVFHQAHAMDVRHFRATHALINPTHHITQNTLGIVVEFVLFVFRSPLCSLRFGHHRELQQLAQGFFAHGFGTLFANVFFHLLLQCRHIHLVIVHGMQSSRCGAWHPSRVGTGIGVCNFLLQHVGHQIRHGPHAFANLRATAQARLQAHGDVASLVGAQPSAAFDIALAHDRACQHASVHFIASAV